MDGRTFLHRCASLADTVAQVFAVVARGSGGGSRPAPGGGSSGRGPPSPGQLGSNVRLPTTSIASSANGSNGMPGSASIAMTSESGPTSIAMKRDA